MTNVEKIANLENTGMLDMMLHQLHRSQSAHFHLNAFAFWQKWIRG